MLLLVLAVFTAACINTGSAEGEESSDSASSGDDNPAAVDESDEDEPADEPTTGGELPEGAVADPSSLASIETVACSFDEPVPLAVKPTCHEVMVPENWADPDPDDRVVLQVAVFEGDGTSPDPIIYFDGGPGGHTLDLVSFSFDTLVSPLLSTRDYIMFDQRGVGVSEPSLACPELVEVAIEDLGAKIDPANVASMAVEAQSSCRDRLVGSGVDLTAYNSVASANDVEAIRALLNYDRMNVVGISYGTRLAQTYMRMFPGSIRSVTLDSVFPTGYELWTNFNAQAERAFEELFAGCEATPDCAEAHPDFRSDFFVLLDQLDQEPAEVEVQNLLDGTTVDAVYDGDDVMGLVFGALYDRSRFASIPQMVEEGLSGNFSTIQAFGSINLTNLSFVSQGMQLSVECNEEIAFESLETYRSNLPTEPPYDRLADLDDGQTIFELCEEWPSGTAPEVESQDVTSDIPTLVLAGQYDPITPPSGADLVSEGLSNSYTVLMRHEGHGITPTECGAEVVNSFIDDPSVEPNSSCVAGSPEPVWVAPEIGDELALVEFEIDGLVSISGLRPEDWTDSGNGVFVRQQTATDPTLILIQPTNGLADATLLDLLSSQLDIELIATGPTAVDGEEWSGYQSANAGGQAARAAVRPGVDGVLVLLVAKADELDPLYDAMFIAVAEAATPG